MRLLVRCHVTSHGLLVKSSVMPKTPFDSSLARLTDWLAKRVFPDSLPSASVQDGGVSFANDEDSNKRPFSAMLFSKFPRSKYLYTLIDGISRLMTANLMQM